MQFKVNLNHLEYVKIKFKTVDGEYCSFKATIQGTYEKHLHLMFPFKHPIILSTPQEIDLKFICYDGLYQTKAKLISYNYSNSYMNIVVETPTTMEYTQEREYFRVRTDFKCICHYKENNQMQELYVQSIDISANGISLLFNQAILFEQDVEIYIDTGNKILKTISEFVRMDKMSEQNYILAFKYKQISTQDQDFISQYCIKKQLENRHKM